eukprot:10584202-Ditylum_brightwellii.AAC.1
MSNPTFHHYIETKKGAFDEEKTVDIDILINKVKTKYTNLGKSTTCTDPKDAKILALTTKLENLEKRVASNAGAYNGTYMPFPHDHDEQKKKHQEISEKRKLKKDKNGNDGGNLLSSKNIPGQKLTLNENLRTVLFTNCGMSDKKITDMVGAYNLYDLKN